MPNDSALSLSDLVDNKEFAQKPAEERAEIFKLVSAEDKEFGKIDNMDTRREIANQIAGPDASQMLFGDPTSRLSRGQQLGAELNNLIKKSRKPTAFENLSRLSLSFSKGALEGTPFLEPNMALDSNQLQQLEQQSVAEKALGLTGFATTSGPLFFSPISRLPAAIPILSAAMKTRPVLGSALLSAMELMLFEGTKPGGRALGRQVSSGAIGLTFGAIFPGRADIERMTRAKQVKEAQKAWDDIFKIDDAEGETIVDSLLNAVTGIDRVASTTIRSRGTKKVLTEMNSANDAWFNLARRVSDAFNNVKTKIRGQFNKAEEEFFKANKKLKIDLSDSINFLNRYLNELGITTGSGAELPKARQVVPGAGRLLAFRDSMAEMARRGSGKVGFQRATMLRRRADAIAETAFSKLEKGKNLSPVEAGFVLLRGNLKDTIFNQAEALAARPNLEGVLLSEAELLGRTTGAALPELKRRLASKASNMKRSIDGYVNANRDYSDLMKQESLVGGRADAEKLMALFQKYVRKRPDVRSQLDGLENFLTKHDGKTKFVNSDFGIMNISAAQQAINTPDSLFRVRLIGSVAAGATGLTAILSGAGPLAVGAASLSAGLLAGRPSRLLRGFEASRGAVRNVSAASRILRSSIPRTAATIEAAIIERASGEEQGEEE